MPMRGGSIRARPELRLKDQDADGIQAEVIYGILGVSTGFSDAGGGLSSPEALTCVYDIYNEWAADFCKADPDRLAALACISSHSPSAAAAQLRRAADLGLRGAEMNVSSASSPIYQDEWNELWETAGECNMPISFHTVGLNYRQPESGASERYETILAGPDVHAVPAIGAGVHDERAAIGGPATRTRTSSSYWGNAESVGCRTCCIASTWSTKTGSSSWA